MLFCSSFSFDLSFPADTSSPVDPWWPTLARVAVLRRHALEADFGLRSMLVEFVDGSAHIDRELDPDVMGSLLGQSTARSARSIGLVTTPVDSPERLSSCTVVDRSGPAATGFWRRDGTLIAAGEASGLVVDLLRRVMGLPTEASGSSTASFWINDWILRAVFRAFNRGRRASVAELVDSIPELPGHASIRQPINPASSAAAAGCAAEIVSISRATSWSRVRHLLMDGQITSPLVSPELATWFDEGSLARWCTGQSVMGLTTTALSVAPPSAEAKALLTDTFHHVDGLVDFDGPTPLRISELLPWSDDD